jgi:hypothetical protein
MYDYEFGIVHESLLDICAFISKAYASYADKEFELLAYFSCLFYNKQEEIEWIDTCCDFGE